MKKMIIFLLFSNFIAVSFSSEVPCMSNAGELKEITGFCRTISPIVCKDVSKKELRSCSEDNDILSNVTSPSKLYDFSKTCFKTSVTSFMQFFTDFLPDLIREIWNIGKNTLMSPSKTLKDTKGMYESVASVSADIYEAVLEDPTGYFKHLWNTLVKNVQGEIEHFDCYNNDTKIGKVCGVISEYIMPPAILAKVIVKGVKGVKTLKAVGFKNNPDKIFKKLEGRKILYSKDYLDLEKKYLGMGYTEDEFEKLYKTGMIQKLEELNKKESDYVEVKDFSKMKISEKQKTTTPKHENVSSLATVENNFGVEIREISHEEFRKSDGLDFTMSREDRDNADRIKRALIEKKKRDELIPPKPSIQNIKVTSGVTPFFKTNFVEAFTKNDMGISTFMPMEFLGRVANGERDGYKVRIYDSSTMGYIEKVISENELKAMRPRETDKALKDIKNFKDQVGLKE